MFGHASAAPGVRAPPQSSPLAPLAQLDRASGYEPGGRTFESCRAHQPSLTIRAKVAHRSLGEGGPVLSIHVSFGWQAASRSFTPPHVLRHIAPRVPLGANGCESCRAHHSFLSNLLTQVEAVVDRPARRRRGRVGRPGIVAAAPVGTAALPGDVRQPFL